MKNLLWILLVLPAIHIHAQTNYQKAWDALNKNNWKEAALQLQEASNDPATFADAFISRLYLETYKGEESKIKDFGTNLYSRVENPYPYMYALWFNSAVAGGYRKKEQDFQVKLLNKIRADEKAPGTLVAAANYQLGLHYFFSNEVNDAKRYYEQVGNIRNWQYTGPFENLSQSGFYKNYGPLENPGTEAVFKTITNAEVKWFVPPQENFDGWTPVSFNFNNTTAVVYAQNFVQSPVDQTVYCAVGASGSLKVWINDELLVGEAKERVTEFDTYIVECNLKKGTNRILIQLGYTSNDYANFSLRFTDSRFRPVPGIVGSPVYAPYPKAVAAKKASLVTPFAESYFTNAISQYPGNLVNYLLLTDVYLRNNKIIEARNVLTTALEKAPENCLLRQKMIEVLLKEDNRTLLIEELERIKKLDPESLLVMEMSIKEFFNNQKFTEGAQELEKRIRLYGEDENTGYYNLLLLIQDKKYDELVKAVEKMHTKYPANTKILEIMYTVKQEVYNDKKGAMKLYDNYMKNNFDFGVYMKYVEILESQGDKDKAFDIKKKMADWFPYSPNEFYTLSTHFYGTKQYDKAEENIRKALALSPYNESYWEQLGDVISQRKNVNAAIEVYGQSLKYDPYQYTILNKIRKLEEKPEIYKLFDEPNVESLISSDNVNEAKNKDLGYYYILDQKDVAFYPGGATEEYYTYLIRITNEKGVDQYKESSIGYGNYQSLLIEKAEVIKKNMSRLEGERNDNEIVFTNLEVGDVVVFKYRIQSYSYGRLAREFYDKYYFGGQIYSAIIRYNVLVPADRKINYTAVNSTMKPKTRNVENFIMYSWEQLKRQPDRDEPLMPNLSDVSPVLHISTIKDWKEISDWYRDISSNEADQDFEIKALYKDLFPGGKDKLSQFEKARIIYNYIETNIRYSSVSFRQSAYVPQRPATTLTTRLGDCKDLSSLFVTLARMAGINAFMVLVNTRDNGQQEIILPSVEFNHCIVKAELDKKFYYIELTDSYLPFASLPNNLNGAAILEIPWQSSPVKNELTLLKADHRTRDVVKRSINIRPEGSDLDVTVHTTKSGHLSSDMRSSYLNLDNEKQLKDMETTVAGGYKNTLKMVSIKFFGLEKLTDSVSYTYNYKVKNEVNEIGSMKTFRVVYPDVVATLNNLSSDERVYPIQYWNYEDVDLYETEVNISAPPGMKFIELPQTERFNFRDMEFSIEYTLKAPDKLLISRRFSNKRENIPASDYAAFKTFFERIIKAEQKFITYK